MIVDLNFKDFSLLAEKYNTIPISATLIPDYDTVLSIYEKIVNTKNSSFLLESNENSESIGRYSIIASNPDKVFSYTDKEVTIEDISANEKKIKQTNNDPIKELEIFMSKFKFPKNNQIPGLDIPFIGGAVGYFSFDSIRYFESSISSPPKDDLNLPDACFMIVKDVIVFDHLKRQIRIISNAYLPDFSDLKSAYDKTLEIINDISNKIMSPTESKNLINHSDFSKLPISDLLKKFHSNTSKDEFKTMVEKAKNYIVDGDVFQVVPSQRFESNFTKKPIDLYRILRLINPSPYLFCLDFDLGDKKFSLVGSSPETHVKCENGEATLRPIAGTRWRGKTKEEDDKLAEELLKDEKEIAEHIMLIDLARNDLGKVSKYGSVELTEKMIVERYSHVMHIVSNVKSKLKKEFNSYDLMRSTFPAGTVSGAPKIRAINIINELEKNKRNTYAGAISYFSFNGNLDSCIALRTCLLKNSKAYIQAGGGVVYDSDPEYEFNETCNKAGAIMNAIEIAKKIFN